jgi:hypothetical protein
MAEGNDREGLQPEQGTGDGGADKPNRNRLIIGYAVVSTLILAVAVVIFILASGGSDNSESGGGGTRPGEADAGGAHINLNTEIGSTNGVAPDERTGIIPAPPQITDLKKAAKKAGCYLELNLKDEGHEHIPPGSPEPEYGTNPPTSGAHVDPPYQQADGAYYEMPEPIDFVHSLEHGRMEIQYFPDLSEKVQRELKGLYDEMYGATLFFPNTEMNYAVAATTWTNLMGCPGYEGQATLDAIRAFGKATWGKYGGEPVQAFTFTGPTPAEPEEPKPAKKSE